MINYFKKLAKSLKLFHFLEKWIGTTSTGMNLFLFVLSHDARNKGIRLNLNKSDSSLRIIVPEKERMIIVSSHHYPYIQDIIDNFDYYFNAVEPIKDDDFHIVDYSKPKQHLLLPSRTPFFFSSFAEPLETTQIYLDEGKLKEGDVVLDIGSYCGATVWAFSNAVGNRGKVYGFEPDPLNFEILSKNVEYHKLSNVVLINKGVWSVSGNLLFQSEGNMGSGISTIQNRTMNQTTIQAVSLNDFCETHKLDKIDYVIIDIEGAEVEVLRAAREFLKKYKPRLIIEPHMVGSTITTNEICTLLSTYGYVIKIITQSDLALPLIYAKPKEMYPNE